MKVYTLSNFIIPLISIDFLAVCNIIKYNLKEVFVIDFINGDEKLIEMMHLGDESAEEELVKRYSKLVRICARPYFLAGGDSEDLIQEGMFGLLSAIRKYDHTGGASFKTYAEQCIHNRIISAIESASRNKHAPLNEGLSLERITEQNPADYHGAFEDLFSRETEEFVLAKEQGNEILIRKQTVLSRFEKQVLAMYLEGWSYKEIAESLDKPEKSIDNAIQRIRKKLAHSK